MILLAAAMAVIFHELQKYGKVKQRVVFMASPPMLLLSCQCGLLFEEVPLLQGECIRFGNDWDNVDHLTETSHEFYIKRPQTGRERNNIREQGRKRERDIRESDIRSECETALNDV